MYCPAYNELRMSEPKLQQPYKENESEVIGYVLFEDNLEEVKKTVFEMWKLREKKMKENET